VGSSEGQGCNPKGDPEGSKGGCMNMAAASYRTSVPDGCGVDVLRELASGSVRCVEVAMVGQVHDESCRSTSSKKHVVVEI
jgi:hypothetical protein